LPVPDRPLPSGQAIVILTENLQNFLGNAFEIYSKDFFPADVLSGQKIMKMAINSILPKVGRRFSPFTLTKKQRENGPSKTFLGERP
jgi:hypothetical protein